MPTLKGAFLSVPVALCSIMIVASGQSGKGPLPIPESESEDIYAVYSAVVRHEFGPRNGNRLLLTPVTIVRDDSVCLKQAIKEREAADREQVSQYLERSRFSYQLLRKLDPGLPFELAKSGSPDGAAQPSGLRVSVSAVGFDSHGNKAVVYLECCGMGGIHFLTKLDGKWTCDPQRMPLPCMWIAWHLVRGSGSLSEMRSPLAAAADVRDN